MTVRRSVRSPRGFTLIELMIVVAIIGVLVSVAIPTFGLVTLRSKAAERHEIMLRIKKAVGDYYVQNGSTIPRGEADPLLGGFQPPLDPQTTKRMPNWRSAGWLEVFRTAEEIEGSLYYSYEFECTEPTALLPATLRIEARGDLDGDGLPSTKVMLFERMNGVYQLAPGGEVPAAGAEDQLTF